MPLETGAALRRSPRVGALSSPDISSAQFHRGVHHRRRSRLCTRCFQPKADSARAFFQEENRPAPSCHAVSRWPSDILLIVLPISPPCACLHRAAIRLSSLGSVSEKHATSAALIGKTEQESGATNEGAGNAHADHPSSDCAWSLTHHSRTATRVRYSAERHLRTTSARLASYPSSLSVATQGRRNGR